jgi:hypothetical protein
LRIAQRPNLKEEIGNTAFNKLINEAIKEPNSKLAFYLVQRPNLKEEIGKIKFNNLIDKTIRVHPNSWLAFSLAQRPNLKAEAGIKKYNELIRKTIDDPGIQLAQGLQQQHLIHEDFYEEFNSLNPTDQQGFCKWLNKIFTQQKIRPAKIQDFSLYFPNVMRGRIQSGLTTMGS